MLALTRKTMISNDPNVLIPRAGRSRFLASLGMTTKFSACRASPVVSYDMTKLLAFVGATLGGYIGWALGALAGPFMAFIMSMIGTGFGMYWGRRLAQHLGA